MDWAQSEESVVIMKKPISDQIKRVLIITYYFPPYPDIGSIRPRGLAKYLPEYGWEPVILTSALPGKPESYFKVIQTPPCPKDIIAFWKEKIGLDPTQEFQKQIGIKKKNPLITKITKFIRSILDYPELEKYWYPLAISIGHDLLNKEKFDVLLSSSPPITCHLIAKKLKEIHKIPWIADLRDLWTQEPYYDLIHSCGPIRRLFERHLEVKTLSAADALVTVSEPWAEMLRLLHRGKPVFTIPNGYDPEEVASAPLTKEFTITYTGRLYEGTRDPTPFFRAIAELIYERKLDRRFIKVRFYGISDEYYWLEKEVKYLGLEDIVSLNPPVPRNIALEKQRESQVLLLLNWNNPKEVGVYTGKVFEYLAAQRPILAIGGPKGVITDLLKETNAGIHVLNYDELKHTLIQFYDEYKTYGQVIYRGQMDRISKYSHHEMARKFAAVLDFVIKR
jgi:glycosyltransferase involved in cell wall biosynthesis